MATTMFFGENVKDQETDKSINLEIGRSSFYRDDSIYISIDGHTVIMTREMAKKLVDSVEHLGQYLNL